MANIRINGRGGGAAVTRNKTLAETWSPWLLPSRPRPKSEVRVDTLAAARRGRPTNPVMKASPETARPAFGPPRTPFE